MDAYFVEPSKSPKLLTRNESSSTSSFNDQSTINTILLSASSNLDYNHISSSLPNKNEVTSSKISTQSDSNSLAEELYSGNANTNFYNSNHHKKTNKIAAYPINSSNYHFQHEKLFPNIKNYKDGTQMNIGNNATTSTANTKNQLTYDSNPNNFYSNCENNSLYSFENPKSYTTLNENSFWLSNSSVTSNIRENIIESNTTNQFNYDDNYANNYQNFSSYSLPNLPSSNAYSENYENSNFSNYRSEELGQYSANSSKLNDSWPVLQYSVFKSNNSNFTQDLNSFSSLSNSNAYISNNKNSNLKKNNCIDYEVKGESNTNENIHQFSVIENDNFLIKNKNENQDFHFSSTINKTSGDKNTNHNKTCLNLSSTSISLTSHADLNKINSIRNSFEVKDNVFSELNDQNRCHNGKEEESNLKSKIKNNIINDDTSAINQVYDYNSIINLIFIEIKNKKSLIRYADSDAKIKQHLIDLANSLFNSFIEAYNKNKSFLVLDNIFFNSTNLQNETMQNSSNTFLTIKSIKREVLIAYSNLIESLNFELLSESSLSNYEIWLINSLSKIYLNKNFTKKQDTYDYNLIDEEVNMKSHSSKRIKVNDKTNDSSYNQSLSNNLIYQTPYLLSQHGKKKKLKNSDNDSFSSITIKTTPTSSSLSSCVKNYYEYCSDDLTITNQQPQNHHVLNSIQNPNFNKQDIQDFNNNINSLESLNLKYTTTSLDEDYIINSKKVKTLHFLLLLFSSFIKANEYLQLETSSFSCFSYINKSYNNITEDINKAKIINNNLDVYFCQKIVIQLINQLCKDNLIKNKILLSISEFDL